MRCIIIVKYTLIYERSQADKRRIHENLRYQSDEKTKPSGRFVCFCEFTPIIDVIRCFWHYVNDKMQFLTNLWARA